MSIAKRSVKYEVWDYGLLEILVKLEDRARNSSRGSIKSRWYLTRLTEDELATIRKVIHDFHSRP